MGFQIVERHSVEFIPRLQKCPNYKLLLNGLQDFPVHAGGLRLSSVGGFNLRTISQSSPDPCRTRTPGNEFPGYKSAKSTYMDSMQMREFNPLLRITGRKCKIETANLLRQIVIVALYFTLRGCSNQWILFVLARSVSRQGCCRVRCGGQQRWHDAALFRNQ